METFEQHKEQYVKDHSTERINLKIVTDRESGFFFYLNNYRKKNLDRFPISKNDSFDISFSEYLDECIMGFLITGCLFMSDQQNHSDFYYSNKLEIEMVIVDSEDLSKYENIEYLVNTEAK